MSIIAGQEVVAQENTNIVDDSSLHKLKLEPRTETPLTHCQQLMLQYDFDTRLHPQEDFEDMELCCIIDLEQEAQVNMRSIPDGCSKKYKPVGQKVHPVPTVLPRRADKSQSELEAWTEYMRKRDLDDSIRVTDEEYLKGNIGTTLNSVENDRLRAIIRKYDKAFATKEEHKGRIDPRVAPPIEIDTVDHKAWKHPYPRYNYRDQEEINEMLKTKIESGELEPSKGAYAGRWFVFRKPNGELRFIQNFTDLNAITIRDAGSIPRIEDIQNEISGRTLLSAFDLKGGYDQAWLERNSRDFTTISTPLGNYRLTMIPQGWTNAVPAYQRTMTQAYGDLMPNPLVFYLDDGVLMGTREKDEHETRPGIRNFVYKHLSDIDEILRRAVLLGITFSWAKSYLCCTEIKVLGAYCGTEGRRCCPKRVDKVKNWPTPTTNLEVNSFLGLCKYCRVFIPNFAEESAPLRKFIAKAYKFVWTDTEQRSFDRLKLLLTNAPLLVPIDYELAKAKEHRIIVTMDAGPEAWGAVVAQVREDGVRRFARFESSAFTGPEIRYHQGRRELKAAFNAVQTLKDVLYGREFILETDSTNVRDWEQKSEFPDANIARWVAFLRLYPHETVHIQGKKNVGADALSRRNVSREEIEDAEDFEDGQMISLTCNVYNATDLMGEDSNLVIESLAFVSEEYDEIHNDIAAVISADNRRGNLSEERFEKAKEVSHLYTVSNGHLFRRTPPQSESGIVSLPRRVICLRKDKDKVLSACHEGPAGGHRSRDYVLAKMKRLFYWKGMYADVEQYIEQCVPCQFATSRPRYKELGLISRSNGVGDKLHIDVFHMPKASNGMEYGVDAKDDLSGYLEAKPIIAANEITILRFLEEYFGRHGIPSTIVADNGEIKWTNIRNRLTSMGINIRFTTAYHPEGNARVERGHRSAIPSIVKWLGKENQGDWPIFMPWMVLASNSTIERTTGCSPFQLYYGREPYLPIQTEIETWNNPAYALGIPTEKLIALRCEEINLADQTREEALEKQTLARVKSKEYFDKVNRIRPASQEFQPGDWVLLHNTGLSNGFGMRFESRWRGPYIVIDTKMKAVALSELDGAPLGQRISSNRLILYKSRKATQEESMWIGDVLLDEKRLRNLWRTTLAEPHPKTIENVVNTDKRILRSQLKKPIRYKPKSRISAVEIPQPRKKEVRFDTETLTNVASAERDAYGGGEVYEGVLAARGQFSPSIIEISGGLQNTAFPAAEPPQPSKDISKRHSKGWTPLSRRPLIPQKELFNARARMYYSAFSNHMRLVWEVPRVPEPPQPMEQYMDSDSSVWSSVSNDSDLGEETTVLEVKGESEGEGKEKTQQGNLLF